MSRVLEEVGKLQLQSQQQNVKTSNTPVTVIDVKTRKMPPEIIEYALKTSLSTLLKSPIE